MTAAAAARSASMRSSTSVRVIVGAVDAEVVAAERARVVLPVAQEVHVLERGAEPPGALDQIAAPARAAASARRPTKARRHISPTTSAEP